MKRITLMLMCSTLFGSTALIAQTETESNFLKDYKAPDYSYRSLILGVNSNGKGKVNSSNLIRFNADVQFYKYRNISKVQGYNYLRLNTGFFLDKTNNSQEIDLYFGLIHAMQEKIFINPNNWFVGVSNYATIGQFNTFIKNSDNYDGLSLRVNPTISFGHGRLEPVYYARKSMDIENALLKSNSIGEKLTPEQRRTLADKIAKLQNRRFYDTRLNRIYQFEALDGLLQEMGIIDEPNMTYFSYLTDAFQFAHDAQRFSGKQIEFGVSQSFSAIERSLNPEQNQKYYALSGFLTYAYHLPASYKIQHNFKTSLILGAGQTFWNNNTAYNDIVALYFEYNFGYYPTTRTFLDVKTYLGGIKNNSIVGVNTNFYYYLSPKVRFNANVNVKLGFNNTDTDIYNNNFLNQLIYEGQPITANNYEFRIGLNYAIF